MTAVAATSGTPKAAASREPEARGAKLAAPVRASTEMTKACAASRSRGSARSPARRRRSAAREPESRSPLPATPPARVGAVHEPGVRLAECDLADDALHVGLEAHGLLQDAEQPEPLQDLTRVQADRHLRAADTSLSFVRFARSKIV